MFTQKIRNNICNYIRSNLQMIPADQMVLGNGLFNRKCHDNAVQQFVEGKCESVILCATIESGNYPIIHFINKLKYEKYQDNTLGWQYKLYEYYVIKEIQVEEHDGIGKLLGDTQDWMIKNNSNWIMRKLSKVVV